MTRGEALMSMAALGVAPLLPTPDPMATPYELNSASRYTAIVGSTAIVGPELKPLPNATILIRDSVIERVGTASDVAIPEGAFRIEASGTYTIPGLIDSHIHFFQSGGLYTRPDFIDLRSVRPYADELRLVRGNLPDTFARYLRSGITSVVDMGGPFLNFDMRALANSTIAAPRVIAAGPLIASVDDPKLDPNGDPPIYKIDTIEAARGLIDREIAAKADLIKIWWIVPDDRPASAFRPIASAAVAYAHERGMRVAIHAYELETARLAVEVGADILAHSVFDGEVDDAFVELLASRNVVYCPTFGVFNSATYTFRGAPNLTGVDLRLANPDVVGTLFSMVDLEKTFSAQRLARIRALPAPEPPQAAMRNLKRIHDAGITVAAGTDAGNIGVQHGSSLYAELVQMAACGLSAKEVLRTATIGGSKAMGRARDLGTIEAGKLADLVILDENPLEDIHAVGSVRFTVKDGHAYDAATILNESPSSIVQRQVNAFNAHDPTVFAETYSVDGAIEGPGTASLRSRRSIEGFYRDLFAKNGALHVEVVSRDANDDRVADRVRMSGFSDGRESLEATLAYRVRDRHVTSLIVT